MESNKATRFWERFWMRRAGLGPSGRCAAFLASLFAPGYKGRTYLARLGPQSYISPRALIQHKDVRLGESVFIGDRVVIYQGRGGGAVAIGGGTHIHSDVIIETGAGGGVQIGADTHVQPRCQFSAYQGHIRIGSDVQIAPNCSFYPYDHGISPGQPIRSQPLQSKGDIVIGDGTWLGVGVTVLDNVRIGDGAVIGAGSVVTRDIPAGGIAFGTPAAVRKMRAN